MFKVNARHLLFIAVMKDDKNINKNPEEVNFFELFYLNCNF